MKSVKKKDFPEGMDNTTRSAVMQELFSVDDDDLPLKTNTPGRLVRPFAFIEVIEASIDPERTDRLSKIFRRAHDKRMISKGGRGRDQILLAMQGSRLEDEEEFRI